MSETGPALDTIIVYTTRIDELTDFYRRGFDLPEPEVAPRHRGWRVGAVYFRLDEVETAPATPGAVRMWFRVDDLDATFARLQELGAQPHSQPRDMPWGDRLASVASAAARRAP